jgi:O-antigen ligase
MYKFVLKTLYFFTFGLIIFKQFNNGVALYASTLVSIIYISLFVLNNLKKLNKPQFSKFDYFIIGIVSVYLLFTFINCIYIDFGKFKQLLVDNIYFLSFILLFIDFSRNNSLRDKVFNFTGFVFAGVSIIALILYFAGYSKIEISLPEIVTLISTDEYLSFFGEPRLSWFMSHKSRYAVFCLIGILFIYYNQKFNILLKILFIFLELLNIYLSSSMTVLLSALILLLFLIDFSGINSYFKWMFYLFVFLSFVWVFSELYNLLVMKRDLLTFGMRIYIWESALNFIKENPFGVIEIDESVQLRSIHYVNLVFANAHNLFLNEFMKHGILGGIIYIIFFISVFIKIISINKRMFWFFISIILCSMIDVIFNKETVPIFLNSMALLMSHSSQEIKSSGREKE